LPRRPERVQEESSVPGSRRNSRTLKSAFHSCHVVLLRLEEKFAMKTLRALVLLSGLQCVTANAALLTFDATSAADNDVTRNGWLAAAGISSPQHLVDFESGFTDGQNVSGQTALFPGGLVITDTSASGNVLVECTANGIGGSDPVGLCAIEHNEQPYLQLDFSANPIDYVAFLNIDHTSTSGIVTFVGGGTANIAFEFATAAEFFGVFRNDMPRITGIELDANGDGTWGIDNIEYGVVPVPAAGWLFGSCFLVALRWMRRRAA
jgi:hypothetical protein